MFWAAATKRAPRYLSALPTAVPLAARYGTAPTYRIFPAGLLVELFAVVMSGDRTWYVTDVPRMPVAIDAESSETSCTSNVPSPAATIAVETAQTK